MLHKLIHESNFTKGDYQKSWHAETFIATIFCEMQYSHPRACRISERYSDSNLQPCGFETSQDPIISRFTP